MARKLVKPRDYQEPIHPDAPGFDSGLGHLDLVTELNEEILPSWQTDIVGGPNAESEDYQLRRNAEGALEHYSSVTEAWEVVSAAGGGGGPGGGAGDNYRPSHRARVVIDSPLMADAFGCVDLVTDESFSGRDIRVFQYGLPKACIIRSMGLDSVSGKHKYRVIFEGVFVPGANEFELRYGDQYASWRGFAPWGVAEYTDIVLPPGDLVNERYALLRYVGTPEWLPIPPTVSEVALKSMFVPFYQPAGAQDPPQTVSGTIYWDNINERWTNPIIGPDALCIDGTVPVTYIRPGTIMPPLTIGFRRFNGDTNFSRSYWMGVSEGTEGVFFMNEHSPIAAGNTQAWENRNDDMVGFLNNGWIVFATYYDGAYRLDRWGPFFITSNAFPVLLTPGSRQTDWVNSPPEVYALVPIFAPSRSTFSVVDEQIV